MAKVIAVCTQKGGVGKTTTSHALSVELVRNGYRVLAVDSDPQGNLSYVLGYPDTDNSDIPTLASVLLAEAQDLDYDIKEAIVKGNEGVDLIPCSIELAEAELDMQKAMSRETLLDNALSQVRDEYDYIVIDSPPSLGIITENILTASDEVIIPIKTSAHSLKGMAALKKSIDKVRRKLNPALKINGMLFTIVKGNTAIAQDIMEDVNEQYGHNVRVYKAMIPDTIKAEEAAVSMQSVSTYMPNHKIAQAYRDFVQEFLESQKG